MKHLMGSRWQGWHSPAGFFGDCVFYSGKQFVGFWYTWGITYAPYLIIQPVSTVLQKAWQFCVSNPLGKWKDCSWCKTQLYVVHFSILINIFTIWLFIPGPSCSICKCMYSISNSHLDQFLSSQDHLEGHYLFMCPVASDFDLHVALILGQSLHAYYFNVVILLLEPTFCSTTQSHLYGVCTSISACNSDNERDSAGLQLYCTMRIDGIGHHFNSEESLPWVVDNGSILNFRCYGP